MDYESDSAELMFVRGSMRECHTVNIIPDEECEQHPENFFSVLRLVRGSPVIAINPSTTEVVIDDSNEPDCSESNLHLIQISSRMMYAYFCSDIRVGYEKTLYTTPEGDVFVELCAIIYEPTSGVAPRPFRISYRTKDYTAGICIEKRNFYLCCLLHYFSPLVAYSNLFHYLYFIL